MTNLPSRYENSYDLSCYDPLDVLYRINPELGSLVYANKSNILNSDILPMIAHFRTLQSQDKKNLLECLIKKSNIDSVERQTSVIARSKENVELIHQNGMTDRSNIEAKCLLETQKMKYETKAAIYNAHLNGQKYLSDNHLEATKIEAYAIRDAFIAIENIKADVRRGVSQDNLRLRVLQMEQDYKLSFLKAETLRNLKELDSKTRVTEAELLSQARIIESKNLVVQEYLRSQMQMYNANLALEMKKLESDTLIKLEFTRTLSTLISGGLQAMSAINAKKFRANITSPYGKISIDWEFDFDE